MLDGELLLNTRLLDKAFSMDLEATMKVADLEIGEGGTVSRVLGKGAVSKRLMELGIVPGAKIRLIKMAPFGDPIEIRVRGFNLAIRKSEAEAIEIARI